METYFENLFFKRENSEEIKNRNSELKEQVQELQREITFLEKNLDDCKYDIEDIDFEILKKLEKKNVYLKNKLEFENIIIMNA